MKQDSFGDGASLIYRQEVAVLMADAMTQAQKQGIDRQEIAKRMTAHLGRKVGKALLDAYSSKARVQHIPPLDIAIAFDLAIGKNILSGYMSQQLGLHVIHQQDKALLELAKLEQEKEALRHREDALRFAAGLDKSIIGMRGQLEDLDQENLIFMNLFSWLLFKLENQGSENMVEEYRESILQDDRLSQTNKDQAISVLDIINSGKHAFHQSSKS